MRTTLHPGYFTAGVAETDPLIADAIAAEAQRQDDVIELIASENIVSRAVLEVQGSILTNKTVEGYPRPPLACRRGAGGPVERAAIERACALFGCAFANVQPHSGSQANHAVLHAVAQPGETILSMDLNAGGHLSHGASVNFSGRWFRVVHYGVRAGHRADRPRRGDGAGARAPAQAGDRRRLGLPAGAGLRHVPPCRRRRPARACWWTWPISPAWWPVGAHASPFPHADIVTTHHLQVVARGPRGAIVLWNDPALSRPIDTAVFPGLQGTPFLHIVAAKAVALGEALKPEFRDHAVAVLTNARRAGRGAAAAGLRPAVRPALTRR